MTLKTASIYFLFLFFFSVFSQDLEHRTLTMESFSGIKAYSGLDIKLIKSNINKAVIFGDQKDDVILSLNKNILKIRLSTKSVFSSGYTYVELHHSKPLDQIIAHQRTTLRAEEPIKQTSLRLSAKTGAVIELSAFTERLDVVSNTGGRVNLDGSVTNFNLNVASSGICEAENLITEQCKVILLAGGFAYVTAKELIDATVIGGGVLRVYGDPIKQIIQTNLWGKIIVK